LLELRGIQFLLPQSALSAMKRTMPTFVTWTLFYSEDVENCISLLIQPQFGDMMALKPFGSTLLAHARFRESFISHEKNGVRT